MSLRSLAVLALPLALYGCQPPPPTVFAVLEDGNLVFHIRDDGLFPGRIFGWDDERYPIDRFWLTHGRRTLVSLTPGTGEKSGCAGQKAFPLRLGEKRCGFDWNGGRSDLNPGVIYAIRLRARDEPNSFCMEDGGTAEACRYDHWWSDGIVGAFVVKKNGRVVNLRANEFPDECGAEDTDKSAIQEEWAEHCLAEPQREGIEKEGGAAENGAGQ